MIKCQTLEKFGEKIYEMYDVCSYEFSNIKCFEKIKTLFKKNFNSIELYYKIKPTIEFTPDKC